MITDDQISIELELMSRMVQIPRLHHSESLHRLARAWCDLGLEPCSDSCELLAANGYEMESAWFSRFALGVVSGAMMSIRGRRHSSELQGLSGVAILGAERNELNCMLEPYSSTYVPAVRKLQEAALLVGLPRNFFVSRQQDRKKFLKEIRRNKSEEEPPPDISCFVRPPVIEPFDKERSESPETRQILASLACVQDMYDNNLKFSAKRGKPTFEHWAIRRLWASVLDVFDTGDEDEQPVIKKPWVTIRDVLRLCEVHVDTEMVRKTIKSDQPITTEQAFQITWTKMED